MFAGVGIYLMFHYIPLLSPLKVLAKGAEDYVMPLMVFIQLFTTFCKVNPREMRICRWHIVMISVQLACCLAVALPIHFFPDFKYGIVAQGALVCLIVPTGTAAAVIVGRLGGNETTLTTYTILSNLVAAVMIPAVFPLVEMQSAGSFGHQFLLILRHVFPLLIYPFPYGVGTAGVPAESPYGGRAAVRKPCILPLGHFSYNSCRTVRCSRTP